MCKAKSQATMIVHPVQAPEIFDHKEANATGLEPSVIVTPSFVNTTAVKAEKLLKANIFARLGFTPRGENSKEVEGYQKKDKSQKKTNGSSKTKDSKSQDRKKRGGDGKDSKSESGDEPKLR